MKKRYEMPTLVVEEKLTEVSLMEVSMRVHRDPNIDEIIDDDDPILAPETNDSNPWDFEKNWKD